MNVAIVGSRSYTDFDSFIKSLEKILKIGGSDLIISGGARGTDDMAEKYSRLRNIPLKVFRADWLSFGKRAGYLRNVEIVKNADIVVAFWDMESKGTSISIDLANKMNKKTYVVDIRKHLVPEAVE